MIFINRIIENMYTEKITIRLTPRQIQVLTELREKYGASFSLMIRTIVGSWLTTNEEIIESALSRTDDNNDIKLFEEDGNENN